MKVYHRPNLFALLIVFEELSDDHIVARYKFRGDEWFYRGHFPGDPVTPGVILIEAMAQTGLVALGLYMVRRYPEKQPLRTLFSECAVEFLSYDLSPGDTIEVRAKRLMWRRNKLRSEINLSVIGGKKVATGVMSGLAVAVP